MSPRSTQLWSRICRCGSRKTSACQILTQPNWSAFWIPDLLSGSLNVGWWDEIDIAEPITAWLLTGGQFRAYRHGLSDDVQAKLSLFLAVHT
jgi:hypothetical protein